MFPSQDMFPSQGLVLVAVSGGADSMTLLDVLQLISFKKGFNVVAAHFNHKLRGDESERDEEFVKAQCKNRNIDLVVGSADIKAYAADNKMGIVESARDCRYDFLFNTAVEKKKQYASGDVLIATAHNADDLAETLLINLIRGAGLSGLSSIPPVRDNIIRPMLHISRNEIMEYINIRNIEYVEDSSNVLTNQIRNKIRHTIMPVILDINPRFVNAAIKTTLLSGYDSDYLQSKAVEYLNSCDSGDDAQSLSVQSFNSLPYSISSRVLKIINDNLSYQHVNDVIDLCKNRKSNTKLSLPNMTVKKERDRIFFIPTDV
jgi:tRNA(Ile)-lysidine synthase